MIKMSGGDVKQELDIAYKRERDQFFEKLQEFHKARGTPFQRIPTFGGQPLDLYALYNTVVSFGGICVVTEKKKWGQVFRALGFPPCTNAAYALKQHYSRYLEIYERIFFLGEDTEDTTSTRSYAQLLKYRRLNKAPKLGPLGEPLVDNFNRISFSLQSGLQNEVDFALNICSLLSNVPNSIFNLAKSPAILDLMLGHVGIWSKDENHVKQLYDEWYTKSEKDFVKFWRRSLEDGIAREIYEEDNLDSTLSVEKYKMDEKNTKLLKEEEETTKEEEEEDTKLFVEKDDDVEANSPECCRINQVCIILYNFSFEQMNAMHLASHDSAVRFLLMASCCNRNNVQRAGLDALDNIANNITLEGMENSFTQRFLQIMDKFLHSRDKFRRCRAMSILAKLATKEVNKAVLTQTLSEDTYKILIETLYLPDIALILASLDTLYCFTSLDEIIATGIAKIHGSIDVLVCLVTVRAETYGNKAIKGYRIIENKHSMFTPKNQQWLREQEEKRMHQNIPMGNRGSHRGPPQRSMHRLPGPGKYPLNPNMPPNAPPYPNYPMNRPPPGMNPNYPNFPPNHPMNNNMPGMNPNYPRPPMGNNPQMSHPEELVEIDAATYTANWMSGFYEPHPSNMLYIQSIHEDYICCCKEMQRKGVLDLAEFIKVLRSIIPPKLAQILPPDSEGKIGISGITRRKQPMPVQSKVPRHVIDPQHPMKPGGPQPPYPLPPNMPPRPPSQMPPQMSSQMPHPQMPQSPRPPPSSQMPHMSPQMPPSRFPPSQMPQSPMPPPQMPQIPRSQMPPHMAPQMGVQMPPQLPPHLLPQGPRSQLQMSQMSSQMPPHLSQMPPQLSSHMPPPMSSQRPPHMSQMSQMPPPMSQMAPHMSSQMPRQMTSQMQPPMSSPLLPRMTSQMPQKPPHIPPQNNYGYPPSSSMDLNLTSMFPPRLPGLPHVQERRTPDSAAKPDDTSARPVTSSKPNGDIGKVNEVQNHSVEMKSKDANEVVLKGKNEDDSVSDGKKGSGSKEDSSVPNGSGLDVNESNKLPGESTTTSGECNLNPDESDTKPATNGGNSTTSDNSKPCPDSGDLAKNTDPNCENPISNNEKSDGNPNSVESRVVPTAENHVTENIVLGKEDSSKTKVPSAGLDVPNAKENPLAGQQLVTEKETAGNPDPTVAVSSSENAAAGNPDTIALSFSKNYMNGENLNSAGECQELIEKLKTEMQAHFMQFHMHRQHIQAIQMQIQQLMQQTQADNLPRNIIKNIQMRVQSHHVQMQSHYQRLQQLNALSEQVQSQLLLKKPDAATSESSSSTPSKSVSSTSATVDTQSSINLAESILNASKSPDAQPAGLLSPGGNAEPKPVSLPNLLLNHNNNSAKPSSPAVENMSPKSDVMSPNSASPSAKQRGQQFIVPPPFPYMQNNMVSIQHGIPNGSFVQNPALMSPPSSPLPSSTLPSSPLPSSPLIPKVTKGSAKGVKARGPVQSPGGRKGKAVKNSRLGRGGKKGNAGDEKSAFSRVKQGAMMNGLVSMPTDQLCSPFQTATGTTPRFPQANMPPVNSPLSGQPFSNNMAGAGMLRNPFSHPLSPGMIGNYPTNSYGNRFPSMNNPPPTKDSHGNSGAEHLVNSTSIQSNFNKEMYGVGSMNSFSSFNGDGTHKSVNGVDIPSSSSGGNLHLTSSSFRNMNGSISGERVPEDSSIEVKKLRDLTEKLESAPKKKKGELAPVSVPMEESPSKVPVNMDSVNRNITVGRVDILNPSTVQKLQSPDFNPSVSMEKANLNPLNLNPTVSIEKFPSGRTTDVVSSQNETLVNSSQTYTNGAVHRTLENSHGVSVGLAGDPSARTVNLATMNSTATTVRPNNVCADEKPPDRVRSPGDDVDFVKHDDSNPSPDAKGVFAKVNGHTTMNNSNNVINLNNTDLNLNRSNNLKLDLHNSNRDFIGATKTITLVNSTPSHRPKSPLSSVPVAKSSTSENIVNLTQPVTDNSVGFYSCKWESCKLPPFRNVTGLLAHMIQIHAPVEGQLVACKVPGCSSIKKPRRVMISHFQEKHCLRRNKDGIMSSVPLPKINLSKEMEWKFEDESPVTRSVRHTAALILRNIARISAFGKQLILPYEDRLALAAISTSEAASGAAECLLELSKFPEDIDLDSIEESGEPEENPDGTQDPTTEDTEEDTGDTLGDTKDLDTTRENTCEEMEGVDDGEDDGGNLPKDTGDSMDVDNDDT